MRISYIIKTGEEDVECFGGGQIWSGPCQNSSGRYEDIARCIRCIVAMYVSFAMLHYTHLNFALIGNYILIKCMVSRMCAGA